MSQILQARFSPARFKGICQRHLKDSQNDSTTSQAFQCEWGTSLKKNKLYSDGICLQQIVAGSLILDTPWFYRRCEDERERDSEYRDSVITSQFTLRLCVFHYKSRICSHLGQVLQTAPLMWCEGIVHLMKCLVELGLKGWTDCSVACLELFFSTTAVFVSCICRSVTYVSGISVVSKTKGVTGR